jgi:hypothetical protein
MISQPHETTRRVLARYCGAQLPELPVFICDDCNAVFDAEGMEAPFWDVSSLYEDEADPYLVIDFYPPVDRHGHHATAPALFYLHWHLGVLGATCAVCEDRLSLDYDEAELRRRAELRADALADAKTATVAAA